jgi:nickel-dependent lactate racemase
MGVEDRGMTFLIALGLHPPMAERDIEERLGPEILQGFRVFNHDPDRGLDYLGKTSQGIHVWVNELIRKADFRIGIGTMAMHPLGYSGGFKILMSGATGRETTKSFHSMALRSPRARWGRLEAPRRLARACPKISYYPN